MNRFLVCYEQSSGSLSAGEIENVLSFGKPLKLLESAWLVRADLDTAAELLGAIRQVLNMWEEEDIDLLYLGAVKLDGEPAFFRTMCGPENLQMYPFSGRRTVPSSQ